jgi:hypothetical protein
MLFAWFIRAPALPEHRVARRLTTAVLLLVVLGSAGAGADAIAVRYPEGTSRAFLTLRNADGRILADGETAQRQRGNRLTSDLVFRFRDGSLYRETTTYTQGRAFRVISDHLVQRGPSFPEALDLSIDAAAGTVMVKYTDGWSREDRHGASGPAARSCQWHRPEPVEEC